MSATEEQKLTEGERKRLNLAVQQRVRYVIQAATKTVLFLNPTKPSSERRAGNRMKPSQLQNVVNAAINAQSVEQLAAFILYQMGRKTTREQWSEGHFGDQVVADLTSGSVRANAEAAVNAMKVEEAARQKYLDAAHLALAQQYLGYLHRLFFFVDGGSGGKDPKRWADLALLLEKDVKHAPKEKISVEEVQHD